MPKKIRVVVYADPDKHKELQSHLGSERKSVSSWHREQTEVYLVKVRVKDQKR
jgi:hypothetical protein